MEETAEGLSLELREEKRFAYVQPQGTVFGLDSKPTRYRADFLVGYITATNDTRHPISQTLTAIEVDGRTHATEPSRTHDNERDRVFRELGVATDRYAGVAILNDPFACAVRAVDHFMQLGSGH